MAIAEQRPAPWHGVWTPISTGVVQRWWFPDFLQVKSPGGPICYHRSFHSCCCRCGYVWCTTGFVWRSTVSIADDLAWVFRWCLITQTPKGHSCFCQIFLSRPNSNFSSPGVHWCHLTIPDSNELALQLFASLPEDGSCDTIAEEGFSGATWT